MLRCKQASYLASKKLDQKLTSWEQFNLKLHTMMCGVCRRYAADIKKLRDVMQKMEQADALLTSKPAQLSEQSRKRIKQAMDKALH